MKCDIKEDTVWGGVQKIYLNYFREGHSNTKTKLFKSMKDHSEAKTDSP